MTTRENRERARSDENVHKLASYDTAGICHDSIELILGGRTSGGCENSIVGLFSVADSEMCEEYCTDPREVVESSLETSIPFILRPGDIVLARILTIEINVQLICGVMVHTVITIITLQ